MADDAYFPGAQVEQKLLPSSEYLPPAHVVHELEHPVHELGPPMLKVPLAHLDLDPPQDEQE